jgi:hypothetical protein
MRKPIFAIFYLCFAAVAAIAQQPSTDRAKVADAYGQTQKRVSRTPERWAPIVVGDLLAPDSAVRTGEHSAVLVQMINGHSIRVGPSSTVELKEVGANSSYSFQLIAGELWSFVNKARRPTRYEVDTPTAVLGVRGTIFHVDYDGTANDSLVSVNEGTVSLTQGAVTQSVEKGYQIRIRRNQLARARVVKHTVATQQMWKVVLRENWAREGGRAKLDNTAEAELIRLKLQERAAAARAARQEARQEAIEKGRGGRGGRGKNER